MGIDYFSPSPHLLISPRPHVPLPIFPGDRDGDRGFFEFDDQLLRDAYRLVNIPGVIVQGRYDVITPPDTAYELSKVWLNAKLVIVPDAGHAGNEPGTVDALVQATNSFIG